jgi:hypothetical protein
MTAQKKKANLVPLLSLVSQPKRPKCGSASRLRFFGKTQCSNALLISVIRLISCFDQVSHLIDGKHRFAPMDNPVTIGADHVQDLHL